MKAWIAGATGFFGSHLVRALLDARYEVVPCARSGGSVHRREVRVVDVLDADAVRASAEGCDVAILAAGAVSRARADAEILHRVHVHGTRTALGALRAARVRRVVYVSTSGTIAVGVDPERVHDETSRAPLDVIATWPYYRAKHYGEREALDANDSPDFEVVVVNPTLLLGPGDDRESSTGDVRKFLERSIPAVPAGGLSFVDVRDAATATVAALARGRAGERYLLSAKNMTVAAFFQRLARVSGVRAPILMLPPSRAVAVGAARLLSRAIRAIGGEPPVDEVSVEMGQYFWYCDPTKAERDLGFSPRDPGETLRETIDDIVKKKRAFPKGARVAVDAEPGR